MRVGRSLQHPAQSLLTAGRLIKASLVVSSVVPGWRPTVKGGSPPLALALAVGISEAKLASLVAAAFLLLSAADEESCSGM